MPRLTRICIALAMLYALLGIAVWSASTLPALTADRPWLALAQPAALHLLTVGWLTQMIFAVAHWLFPKHPTHPPRGRNWLPVASAVALNAGVLLRLIAEPAQRLHGTATVTVAVAAFLLWLGTLGFVVHLWPRVR